MTFISYAQNYEDVVLWRALRDVECGFYVDVGAADPTVHSVTRAFYERGWSGFNIEPTEPYFTALESQRPRDINLRVLAGARTGVRTLHIIEGEGAGLSTINGDFAARHVNAGYPSRDVVLPELSLNQILETRAGLEIHFLKIDVEGAEVDVLSGIDLKAFRPWIILVEATEPNSQTPNRDIWEHLLIKCDYQFAYFDGLNCFYTAIERAELKEKLAVPPNVFDDFLPFSQSRLQDDLIEQTHRAQELVEAQTFAAAELARFQTELERTKAGQATLSINLQSLSEEVSARSRAADNLQLDSRLKALEEFSADLGVSLLGSPRHYGDPLPEYANIVNKFRYTTNEFSAFYLRTQYLLNRSTLEKLLFRADGRPVKGLRRLLFHKSRKPRKLFRILILRENGEPRRAFSYWMTSPEQRDDTAPVSPPSDHSNVDAVDRRQYRQAFDALSDGEFARELTLCVELVYRYYLGRSADADGLQIYVDALRNGMTLSALARTIENSPEAVARQQYHQDYNAPSDGEFARELAFSVELLYWYYLGRSADADALRIYVDALRNGMTFSALARTVENSPEAVDRRQYHQALDAMSDGEFVVALAEFLFQGRGALPEEVEHWKNVLVDDRAKRIEMLKRAAESFLANKRGGAQLQNDPADCPIMGTDRRIDTGTWENKARELCLSAPAVVPSGLKTKPQPFRHSEQYVVSAIASLYRGGRYIEQLLDNITNQTIFDRSELIIIDAESPEGEEQTIAKYQKKFQNIIYKRINYRIGVYDAWNIGLELSRGRYLTNTNLDDLRRCDSFELQAAALDRYDFIDVVYQDFFYNFDDSLSFEEIEKFGFKSDLPIITPHNLLKFNSPHNGPMWRKSLHAELGLFDTQYKSAGDWEFWMRCLSNGKNFLKINTPHVAYFQNPNGISTRPDTRGFEEAQRVLRSYSDKLISHELRLSREGLAEALGTQADWDATTSHYDVVQRELNRLGARCRGKIETTVPA